MDCTRKRSPPLTPPHPRPRRYVVSDMNCYATHLLKYTRTKWVLADGGPRAPRSERFIAGWRALLHSFGIAAGSALAEAIVAICDRPRRPRDGAAGDGWTMEQGEMLRTFFQQKGRAQNGTT